LISSELDPRENLDDSAADHLNMRNASQALVFDCSCSDLPADLPKKASPVITYEPREDSLVEALLRNAAQVEQQAAHVSNPGI
jgi:hypothetical protein